MAKITDIPHRIVNASGVADTIDIHVYQAGSSTSVTLYDDESLTNPVSNPYTVASGNSVPTLYHGYPGEVRIEVVDAGSATIFDDDPYDSPASKADLASTESEKGAVLVGRAGLAVSSIAELIEQSQRPDLSYLVTGYHPGSTDGGGAFWWVAGRPKEDHDGVIVIDPELPWPADWTDDGDLAAWFTAADSGTGCFVRQDVTALTPEMAGALPSPIVTTRQFAALAAAMKACRKVRFKSGATYRAAVFAPPARSYIDGNDALFERSAPTANPLIILDPWSVIEDMNVDGRQGDGVTSTSNREHGIGLDDYCIARRCTATRVRRHGISSRSPADKLEYYGILIEDCYGHDCGVDPSPAGTGSGDGINLTNCHNSKVVRGRGHNNSRSGVVSSSFNTSTMEQDATLCSNIIFEECEGLGNAYGSCLNQEAVTSPKFIRCRTDQMISFRMSPHAVVEGGNCAAVVGNVGAHYPTVIGVRIVNATRGHELIGLLGNSPIVRDCYCETTFGTPAGNVVQILPGDGLGDVHQITVVGGMNGVRINVDNFSKLRVSGVANVAVRDGPDGNSRAFNANQPCNKFMGRLTVRQSVAPAAGVWNVGDEVQFTTPTAGGNRGAICTTAGTAGVDAVFKNYAAIAA